MAESAVERDILEEIRKLDMPRQERVLEFARSLTNVQSAGIPGEYLLRFAGAIDRHNLEEIAQAIDMGCERVERNEW